MANEEHELIVQRIQYYLDEQNITQNRLAQLAGISQSTLNALMNRSTAIPKVTLIHKICLGLGITVKEFFDFPPYNSIDEEVSEKELGQTLVSIKREIAALEKKLADRHSNNLDMGVD
ncbi:helix-turn-helix domain-containing protein [Enterococcus sp. BWR-S5]|uniref:helix-turn-helix domain-containing protein n=1 Tax=Enterococcus sp. BWR-S5 TaxID=2787714 RepID=UPI001920A35B|nr:helix-turn-helix transcriptional regulator [Enterococcus sp. BWR-S5]MBL1224575.1 helix-turn-helix transcriptional regulator [Enterococcus sp. BWR-S5]MBL1224586.1 helix-turn-helix transcriptional regulator [Enterococcus sp. BWR-S5]